MTEASAEKESEWYILITKDNVLPYGITWEDLVYYIKDKFGVSIFHAVDIARTFSLYCQNSASKEKMIENIKKNWRGKWREALLYLADRTEWR
jgi:hypothetical protein